MKTRILDALKAKFEGVSDSILSRIADKLAKTVTTEDQVKPAVDGVTLQQVLESYGDSRATEAQQTAISNYEKKHGLKDGKQVDNNGGTPAAPKPEPETPAGDKDVPEWAKALLESNKALGERLNRLDTERATANRKQQLSDLIQKLPDNLRKGYERISLDKITDEDFSTLKDEISNEVDSIVSDLNAKGAVFGQPTANNSGGITGKVKEATDAEAQAVVDRLPI